MVTKVRPFREFHADDPSIPEGEMRLNFHVGQKRAWLSPKRIVCLQCGTQYGKTCLGPHWISREMDTNGPGDYMAVTTAYPLSTVKMVPELREVFERILNWGVWKEKDQMLQSHEKIRGAPAYRIIVGTAQKPSSLESGTVKAAWLDEVGQHEFLRESWEAINRRVSIARGRLFLTTTLYEFGWYKYELYDRWKAGDPDIDIIEGDSTDNPAFSVEEYERAKSLLPKFKFDMFYRGKFEKPSGLIYDSFNEDICLISRFNLDPTWPRYVGHDFGPNNTAAVWYAQDPATGYLYVYRTYHEGELSNFDHAQKWKKMSEGEMILNRVGGARAETGFREACSAAGWPITEPKEFGVEAGINIVYGWHQQNRLFVFKDCDRYLAEKMSYTRELGGDYEVTEKIFNKSRYHLMDAERYVLSHLGPERVPGYNEKAKVVYHNGQDGPTSDKRKRKMSDNPQRKFWRDLV